MYTEGDVGEFPDAPRARAGESRARETVEMLHEARERYAARGRSVGREAVSAAALAREAALIAVAILLYFGIRNSTVGSEGSAVANAERLIRLEHELGISWEGALQDAVVSRDALVTFANWVYIFGHWPVILGVGAVLYRFRRRHYYLLRNAMFASGLIGFLFFALFPVAPPRLLDLGMVDTVTERSDAYRALQPPGLTNQYAAFPSLHVGWNILVGIVVVLAATGVVVRLAALLLPAAMALAVVVTANHFLIDVLGGAGVVLIGLAVAILVQRRQAASTLTSDGVSGDPGGRPPERAVRRRAPRGKLPRQAA
jgi:membrane-associated phospholipid phosphatase